MSGLSWKAKLKGTISNLPSRNNRNEQTASLSSTPTRNEITPPASTPAVTSLRLLSPNNLEVTRRLADGQLVLSVHDLNESLGNDNGSFSSTGKNFAFSARNVRLVDYSLWATLATMDGRWQHDRVGLDISWQAENTSQVEVRVVDYDSSHTPSLRDPRSRLVSTAKEDFKNLTLISNFLLAAECLQPNGSHATSFLDLDGYIGNDNGKFSRGGGFSHTAENVQLSGTTLTAKLYRNGGSKAEAVTDISRYIRVHGGRLLPLRKLDPAHDTPVIHLELHDMAGRLPGCSRVWIVKPSILLADCYAQQGALQRSAFRLDSLFGLVQGRLRPFGLDFTKGGEPAERLELKGSILHMLVPQPSDKGENKQKLLEPCTVDLAQYLVNENGSLAMRKGGSGCGGCSNIFRAGLLYSPWGKKQRERLTPFRAQVVNEACGLCRLARNLVSVNGGKPGVTKVFIETMTNHFDEVMDSVILEIKDAGISKRYTVFLDSGFGVNPLSFSYMTKREVSEPWFQPEQRWSLVSAWLEECFHTHKECARTGRPFLPTRCLDLGTSAEDIVRVITPSMVLGRYICLSHCWGSSRICTLTSKTFKTYTTAIPSTDLPTTYNDAIVVCRYLGIRYLWIDSLCIIQDSREDWLRECPKMTDYYGHCYACIAATSSSSSGGGLGIDRRPSAISAEGSDPAGNWYNLFAYPSELMTDIPHFSRADDKTLEQNFPLMRRGWVLQERWLTPRTIHFGRKEVIFECAEGLACECGRAKESFWVDIGDKGMRLSLDNMNDGAVLKRTKTSELRWTQLVVAYSALNLSFANDRLPAVSGLARSFAAAKENPEALGKYAAGLWENNLHNQLVWFVGAPLLRGRAKGDDFWKDGSAKFWTTEKTRRADYVAPTWSWAGVFEAVGYRSPYNNNPLFEVLECHIALQGTDPFGSVDKGCYLKIKGRLLKTYWEIVGEGSGNVPYLLTSIIGSQLLDHDEKPGIGFLPDYLITRPDAHQIPMSEELFVLPVLTQNVFYSAFRVPRNSKGEDVSKQFFERVDKIRNTMCLVLRRREADDAGEVMAYERVGFTEYANIVKDQASPDPNKYEAATILLY